VPEITLYKKKGREGRKLLKGRQVEDLQKQRQKYLARERKGKKDLGLRKDRSTKKEQGVPTQNSMKCRRAPFWKWALFSAGPETSAENRGQSGEGEKISFREKKMRTADRTHMFRKGDGPL